MGASLLALAKSIYYRGVPQASHGIRALFSPAFVIFFLLCRELFSWGIVNFKSKNILNLLTDSRGMT